ncbi:hypothetical protein RUM8411_00931 [Ruegeria meonggei]|uniref:Uncharacterized protein n=3 Tax=Ruegeria meonggei TaxID=1446476 RepID=A0A1X6YJZ8_9RHOB|nr:hypothetical protein RUM8411_00931 [Ruegeria meonggei]
MAQLNSKGEQQPMYIVKKLVCLALGAAFLGAALPPAATAQVAQWNQVVSDPKLQESMHRAIREVATEYVNELDEAGVAGAIAFVDTQLDYPLQLASPNFRHLNLNALQAKAAYVMTYQAKTSAGVNVTVAPAISGIGLTGGYGGLPGPGNVKAGGHGEIPGDGAMMLCPINKAGLEFMSGVISIASLDASGQFRVEQDGADIIRLHGEILRRTYEYYGHTPEAE